MCRLYQLHSESEVPGTEVTDKTSLQRLYDENIDMKNEGYTAESWQALQDALSSAKSVLNDPAATQSDVEKAAAGLQIAIDGLEKEAVSVGDKNMLQALLIMADKDLGQDGFYEEEGLRSLQNAADEARLTADDPKRPRKRSTWANHAVEKCF